MSVSIVKERIVEAKERELLFLDLRGLMLNELPEEICDLKFVIEIDLSYNQFTKLPIELITLPNLLNLDLSHNYIMEIDFDYGHFYGLMNLNISNNFLYSIPISVSYLNNTNIVFENNPFLNGLPPETEYYNFHEIVYFLDLIKEDNEIHKFYETKLIFVGGGEVGKTTLMKVLQKPDLNVELGAELTTHGININSLNYEVLFAARPPHYNNYKDINDVYIFNEYVFYSGYINIEEKNQDDDSDEKNEDEADEEEEFPTFNKDGMRYSPKTAILGNLDEDERAGIVLSKNLYKL